MFGLLNVDKPAGITSRDAVNRVQRLVRPLKVGHAGTLDPLATGVLVVAIGPAARLIEYIQRLPKTYQGTFLLGRTSDTEDIEGTVVEMPLAPKPARAQIDAAIPRFIGQIDQRPPAYSALKISGRRAYKMARRGDTVDLAPRPVEVYDLQIIRYDYPELELLVRCGSGTYIRSLGRDLAAAVGTGAVMSALRRLAVGPFKADEALRTDKLDFSAIQSRLQSPLLAVEQLPRIALDDHELAHIIQGRSITDRWGTVEIEIAAVSSRGELAAILVPAGNQSLRPTKCFAAQ
jgi:tRNA pseudouridine55 synthase